MWYLLLLIYYLKFEHLKAASLGPGRVRYSLPVARLPPIDNQMVLSLPDGFNPPKPPIEPLLYPFEKNMERQEASSDWRPIIPRSWLKTAVENEEKPKDIAYSNHRYESVVFGPWQPVSPLLIEQLPKELNKEDKTDYKNVTPAEDRNYVLIGGRGRTKNHTAIIPKTTSFNQTIGLQLNKKNIIEITTVTEEYHEPQNHNNLLLHPPSTATATATSLSNNVWPKDFVEEIFTSDNPQNMRDINANEDFLLETSSMNITKLGVPFEDTNSTDKASICVPLTVQAHKSAKDIVEVDRVYCFPLPAASENPNITNWNATNTNKTDILIERNKIISLDSAAGIRESKYILLSISLLFTRIIF